METIKKWLVNAAIGFLVLIGAALVAFSLVTTEPIEAEAQQDKTFRPDYSLDSSLGPINAPRSPAADFPSDEWKSDGLQWYVQWKRVRKYARIGIGQTEPAGFAGLRRQARELRDNVTGWREGPARSACLTAAEELFDAVTGLHAGDADAAPALQASEVAGDRCLSAVRSALAGRR